MRLLRAAPFAATAIRFKVHAGRTCPLGQGWLAHSMRGFGTDRVAVAITHHLRAAWVLAAAVTVLAALALATGLAFNGDVSAVLKKDTPGYRALKQVEEDFHAFSTDEVLVVEAADLGAPEAYDALESFVLDLQLVEGVEAVISVFALPGADSGAEPYLGSDAALALGAAQRLDTLIAQQPFAGDLMAADRAATVVIVMAAGEEGAEAKPLSEAARAEIEELAAGHSGDIAVTFAGIGAIHRAIEQALRADQKLLASVSITLCVVLALAIFRSWRGALICAVPPLVGVVWFFGFAAVAGIAIDPVTTIIPTLLIVVGFADTVHLYFSYLRTAKDGVSVADTVRRAVMETGPACFLTSLTTALACLGIGIAGSATLNAFAFGGFAGMLIQFAAVIVLFPLLAIALGGRGGAGRARGALRFSGLARLAMWLLARPRGVIGVAVVLFAALLAAQAQLHSGFRLSEHLRDESPLRQVEMRLRDKGLATGQLFAVIADADGEVGFGAEDSARMAAVMAAVAEDAVRTPAPFFLSGPGAGEMTRDTHPLLKRFISRDGLSYLVPVPIDLSLTSTQIAAEAARIGAELDEAGLGGTYRLTGLALLSATEVPRMIADLRLGFYVALVLVMGVLVAATGSLRLGLLSLLPNLIPILGVEAWLWISGQQLSMTASVALTIAFGIVVDDSIHYFNSYQRALSQGRADAPATAIGEVASPIAASTLLLVAGLSVTQVSSLPTVAVFGQLVCAALILALAASLFILPSFVTRFGRPLK